MKSRRIARTALGMAALGLFALSPAVQKAWAQAASTRFLGTITAISGNLLTVKPAQEDARQFEVPATADLKRVEPGQTNLSAAVAMTINELAVGDRVLVNLDPNAAGSMPQALRIVAIKQQDVAQKQQQETEEWQHGVGGLVKSVDAADGVILLASGAGPTAKTVTVHVTQATALKRYAPGSVRFEEATAALIGAIQPGDQLRARGQKNANGTEIAADEVVSGSFRNISGTIASVDPAGATLVVKDLLTKKQVTIHITAESQMRRLPDRMAQMLAARLKGVAAGGYGGQGQSGSAAGGGGSGRTGSGPPGMQRGGGNGGGDSQQMLSRAPAIQLSDLQKGEAVMLVSAQGASDVTAITLLAGVEPLLEAPASQDLLANWSMGSSAPEEAVQ